MKTIFKLLIPMLAAATICNAQDKPKVAFVRIVNAVSPGTGNAKFLVDGKDLYPDGYSIGQTTGGYGVVAGEKTIEVRKEGVEKGLVRIKLAEGETLTLIAFGQEIPPVKPNDPVRWKIKLLTLKQKDEEKGFHLSIVSVSKIDEVPLQVAILTGRKEEKAYAKRLSVTSVDIGRMRSEVAIKSRDKTLTMVSPDSRGNYVVVVYDNAEGQIEAISFYDPKFVVAG